MTDSIDIPGIDAATVARLFALAQREYNHSSYGHGHGDGQSAEYAVATELEKLGLNQDDAFEYGVEIAARAIQAIEE